MMHYHPTPENCAVLKPEGFLLVDCGGHYLEGTTDITRTYALGEPTEEEKDYFTLVLRSHIDMAKLVFKEKMPGIALDLAAREPFWERGLDIAAVPVTASALSEPSMKVRSPSTADLRFPSFPA